MTDQYKRFFYELYTGLRLLLPVEGWYNRTASVYKTSGSLIISMAYILTLSL